MAKDIVILEEYVKKLKELTLSTYEVAPKEYEVPFEERKQELELEIRNKNLEKMLCDEKGNKHNKDSIKQY